MTKRYQELDAVRGIAALMVALFHFTMGRPKARLGFKLGLTGVDLFFIISGFVIYISINRVKTAKEFIINRVSRLYPTYWACVTFTFLVILTQTFISHGKINLVQYLGNMTMFQLYLLIPDLDGSYWTMVLEMDFYILMLLLFHFKLTKYLNPFKYILPLFPVFLFVLLGDKYKIGFILLHYTPFLRYMPLFYSGMLFYKIYKSEKKRIDYYIILAICFFCQVFMFKYLGRAKECISQSEYTIMLFSYFLIFYLFVTQRLMFIVSPLTLFLGKISFSLYLVHQYISLRVILPSLIYNLNLNFWVSSLFITLPIVIGIASFITFFIEIPLGKKMKDGLQKF